MKRILCYFKGTSSLGLLYKRDGSKDPTVIVMQTAWAEDANDRKSTSGYLFLVSGAATSWRSKKQTCVALFTAEAEYVALASAAQEAMWLCHFLSDLKNETNGATVIFEDYQTAICMAENPQLHGRAKHIDIKYHFIREQVNSGTVELKYCQSEKMIADILTKGLP